jgi:transcription elongation factor Elf1
MDRVRFELTSVGRGGKLEYFCPFESVICYYMIECVTSGKYHKITINDLYNIVNVYSKVFDPSAVGHEACQCKAHFTHQISDLNENEKKCHKYLMHHYDRMKHLIKLLDDFSKKYPEVDWQYNKYIQYDGECEDLTIYKRYTLLGYDKENVYTFDIKPQLTSLNHSESKVNGILDTWLISHVTNTDARYANKNIISCVLSLNITEVYTTNWTEAIHTNSDYLNNQIYTAIEQTHQSKNKSYYTTFMNVIEEKKDVKNILSYLQSTYLDDEGRKRPIPEYIIDFWKFMKNRIEDEDGKSAKMALLSEYKNETYFLTKINRYLHRSLNAFFRIEEDDE